MHVFSPRQGRVTGFARVHGGGEVSGWTASAPDPPPWKSGSTRKRKRRVLKWAGLILSLLIVTAWIVSLFWSVHYTRRGSYIDGRHWRLCPTCGLSFAGGCLTHFAGNAPKDISGVVGYLQFGLGYVGQQGWMPYFERTFFGFYVSVPLWILLLLVVVPTVFLFWHDRMYPGHCCQRCGYDLRGNISGVCPECGQALVQSWVRTPDSATL